MNYNLDIFIINLRENESDVDSPDWDPIDSTN